VGVTWSEPEADLGLWANARQFLRTNNTRTEVVAEIPTAGGELLVYVYENQLLPAEGSHVRFTVATSVSEQ
jgi:hypothetical protein